MKKFSPQQLGDLVSIKTGKLNSNAARPNGRFPFFTCSPETLRTDTFAFDCECVLLAGNNANGRFPLKYFNGKFDAYQRTYVLEPLTSSPAKARYLYYALQPLLRELQALSTGATTKFLTLPILRGLPVRVPPPEIQSAIVDVLGTLDDLIENNRRRVELLEEMARTIYQEWFVDFRFPGCENASFVDSPLGRIPDGWHVTTLEALSAVVTRGISPKYDDDGEWLVLNQKCIRDRRVSFAKARRQSKVVAPAKRIQFGDVLINSTGVGTLGRVSLYLRHETNVTVDSHVTIVRPSSGEMNPWFGMRLCESQSQFEALGTGSTGQTELSRVDIGSLLVAVPPVEARAKFEQIVSPLLKKTLVLLDCNVYLEAARDALLPKLVTGQIDVSDFDLDQPVEGSVA